MRPNLVGTVLHGDLYHRVYDLGRRLRRTLHERIVLAFARVALLLARVQRLGPAGLLEEPHLGP